MVRECSEKAISPKKQKKGRNRNQKDAERGNETNWGMLRSSRRVLIFIYKRTEHQRRQHDIRLENTSSRINYLESTDLLCDPGWYVQRT